MKRYNNENDPRLVIFASNSDKRYGTAFNFAHPPKWRWILAGILVLALYMCGNVLLVAEVLAFAPMADFCSFCIMRWNLPNGEQTKFRVPINDVRKPHSDDGWKAYRGYRAGKSYLLIKSGANSTSVVPVGTKGPVDFVVPPMEGDDITVFNMHSKRVFHVKRGVDGVWGIHWVQ